MSNPTAPKSNRLWLDNRKLRALSGEPLTTQKQTHTLPPKPRKDSTRLKPLSPPALQALQRLWVQYASQIPNAHSVAAQAVALNSMELVGAHLTVVRASNPTYILLSGVVIDESEHMIYLQSVGDPRRILSVIKQGTHFELSMNGKRMVLLGQGIDRVVPTRTKAKRKKITDMLE